MWKKPARLTTLIVAPFAFVVASFAFVVAALFAAGCGGDDGGSGNIDASATTADAMVTPDAATDDAFLGVSCPETACTAAGSTCLSVKTVPTKGYCSIPCGESNLLSLPPEDGDAMCDAIYDQAVGTPKCGIVIDSRVEGNGTIYTWACAIDCSADDQCPGSDLTCQDFNFTDRFCLR